MNKTELVAAIADEAGLSKKDAFSASFLDNPASSAIADEAGLSKKDAEKALKAFTDVVTEELKKGEKVQLVGFGTFEVSERAAREGRNPQTGAAMKIAASKAPKFKAGKALKDLINA